MQEQLRQHNDQGDMLNVAGRDGDLKQLTWDTKDINPEIDIGPEFSLDKMVNDYGRSLLNLCKATGYKIMNGRLHNDKNIGEFTFESELEKSVIDLLICKPSSIQMINKLSILSLRPTESEHKPVTFSLMLTPTSNYDSPINEGTTIESYKWDHTKLEMYLNTYNSVKCETYLNSILLSLTDSSTNSDDICKCLYNYIESAIDECFQKKSSKRISQFPNNPWFDDECKVQKSTKLL